MIKVIKKDRTKEEFNVQKVIVVNKSAYRALVKFTDEEIDFICKFVTEKVEQMRKKKKLRFLICIMWSKVHGTDKSIGSEKLQNLPCSTTRTLYRC